jgi:hypothetical protein
MEKALRFNTRSSRSAALPKIEARLDGERVVIEAKNEIVLVCGQASIVLRRNGRIAIYGTHLETRSKGINRIRGGIVELN